MNDAFEAQAKAERLHAEALQLEKAEDYQGALVRLTEAEPYVEIWGDPDFCASFYSHMAFLNHRLGYSERAVYFAGKAMDASNRAIRRIQ